MLEGLSPSCGAPFEVATSMNARIVTGGQLAVTARRKRLSFQSNYVAKAEKGFTGR